jgi:hypothetical protein
LSKSNYFGPKAYKYFTFCDIVYILGRLSLSKGFVVEARNSVPYMGTWGRGSQWCNRLPRSIDLEWSVFLWERESEKREG